MELIDRYVYAVVKRLPATQRADIEKELRSLIEDMTAETVAAGQPEKSAVDSVLRQLGHPALLAAQYRGVEQHLRDWSDLRAELGLGERVPDHSTLQKAADRLLKKKRPTPC